MSGAILAVSGLACCICFAIAAIYWGRGGYANVKIAFPWIIAAAVFFVGAAISAYWYYVVKPASQEVGISSERPNVFYKIAAMAEPLSPGKDPVVAFTFANSGPVEAQLTIRDFTSYFEGTERRGSRPKFLVTEPTTFTLSPTAQYDGRMTSPGLYLTADNIKDIREGRANLYFFAKGEYKDEVGRTWPLPFCRKYAEDFPGKLILCPNDFQIGEPDSGAAPVPQVGIDGYKFLTFEAGKKIQIQAVLTNRGQRVAYRLRVASALSHGYPPIPKPFIIPVKDGDPISSSELSVGGAYNITLTSAEPITTKQFAEIIDGKRGLYVLGKGTYYDQAGKCYPVKYCAFFDHTSRGLAGCPEDVEYEHQVTGLRCPN